MKITIELDGVTVPATTSAQDASSGAQGATAPTDVLARAQALGAIDGGRAPVSPPQTGAPSIPATISGPATSSPGATAAMSAGAAPGMPGAPSVTVEQDPDAPSAPDEEG